MVKALIIGFYTILWQSLPAVFNSQYLPWGSLQPSEIFTSNIIPTLLPKPMQSCAYWRLIITTNYFTAFGGLNFKWVQVLYKVRIWAALLCNICRYAYMHAGLQHRGSTAYKARASPTRHTALHLSTCSQLGRLYHILVMYIYYIKISLSLYACSFFVCL